MKRVAIIVACLIAASCSIGHDRGDMEHAITSYSRAMLNNDTNAAWDQLSTRCQEKVTRKDWTFVVAALSATYKFSVPRGIRIVSADTREVYDGRIKSDYVLVDYSFDDNRIDQRNEPWRFEGGKWRNDEC